MVIASSIELPLSAPGAVEDELVSVEVTEPAFLVAGQSAFAVLCALGDEDDLVGAHRAGFYDLRPAQSDEALRNPAVAGPL